MCLWASCFDDSEVYICLGDDWLEEVHSRHCNLRYGNFDDAILEIEQLQNLSFISIFISNGTTLNSVLEFSEKTSVYMHGINAVVYCAHNNSGIVFRNSTRIQINGLTFHGCGSVQDSTSTDFMNLNSTLPVKCALYFIYCTGIFITSVNIEHSDGVGLVVYNSNGSINITACNFTNNSIWPVSEHHYAGGGGIRFGLTSCPVGEICEDWHGYSRDFNTGVKLTISDCILTGNKATTLNAELGNVVLDRFVKQRLGRGGGVFVLLGRFSCNVTVSIENSEFYDNEGIWGGGMFLSLRDSAVSNLVTLSNCLFSGNKAHRGHGGLSLNFNFRRNKLKNNNISVIRCNFSHNMAPNGGGVAVYSTIKSGGTCTLNNTSLFSKCSWVGNVACNGAGLLVESDTKCIPRDHASVVVESCSFNYNTVDTKGDFNGDAFFSSYKQSVLSIALEFLRFDKRNEFRNNTGTALMADSSVIQLCTYGKLIFVNNSGIRGGALSLLPLSKLVVLQHTEVSFEGNQAVYYGGAVYVENLGGLDRHLFSYVECPIQCKVDATDYCNSSFTFVGNYAGDYEGVSLGNSVYFGFVESCVFLCTRNESVSNSFYNIFKCLINENSSALGDESDFVTADRNFEFDRNDNFSGNHLEVVPGKEFNLPVKTVDGFGRSVYSIYYARMDINSDLEIDGAYKTVSSAIPRLLIYGDPKARGTLQLVSTGYILYEMNIEVTTLPCPPGHGIVSQTISTGIDRNKIVQICACYNNWKIFFHGILCRNDYDEFKASLRYGYWAGYVGEDSLPLLNGRESPSNFFTSVCPLEYCLDNCVNESCLSSRFIPTDSDVVVIDKFMCGERRTGILCGKCRENHSVFFHSLKYNCFPDRLCHLGWLFYILSELVPVTALFLLVIAFNISFTKGAVYGFMFFAQTIDLLLINFNYSISGSLYGNKTRWSFQIYQLVYRFFNLDFFGLDYLSFCLWSNASALDMSVFKYVTILYFFLLVIISRILMKRLCISRFIPEWLNRGESCVVQGLPAFLALSYTQCVLVSFQLLFAFRLHGINHKPSENLHVFLDGSITFFSRAHLPYAIPALLCLFTFVLLPPLILLWYPLAKQVLAKCGLVEMRLVSVFDYVLRINQLKPVIDCFQSSFKDHCRYFAGLYFVYRILLIAGIFAVKQSEIYALVSIFLLVLLLVHSVLQPFKKHWCNVVNGIFLALELAISSNSFFIYYSLFGSADIIRMSFISAAIGIQEFLICVPVTLLLVYIIVGIFGYFRKKCSKKGIENFEFDLSLRSTENLESHEYNVMEDYNY